MSDLEQAIAALTLQVLVQAGNTVVDDVGVDLLEDFLPTDEGGKQ